LNFSAAGSFNPVPTFKKENFGRLHIHGSNISMKLIKVITTYSLLQLFSFVLYPRSSNGLTIYNKEELKQYPPLLLSICGNVYNVTAQEKLFGHLGVHEAYSKKDITRAIALADFSEDNLTDDLSGFSGDECIAADTWSKFFHNEESLHFMGVLDGYFFNQRGEETVGNQRYKKCLSDGIRAKEPNKVPDKGTQSTDDNPECVRTIREGDQYHVVRCDKGYTPRKTYFTAGYSVNTDGTSRNIRIITCCCLDISEVGNRLDLEMYDDKCDPTGTHCPFDNHENDIHH
jgi:hypothetical protein